MLDVFWKISPYNERALLVSHPPPGPGGRSDRWIGSEIRGKNDDGTLFLEVSLTKPGLT